MQQKLIIPNDLPTMNEIIARNKTHWAKYSKSKKVYTDYIAILARKQLKPVKKYPVDFCFHWYCPNKRKDKDNIAAGRKYILDGLVSAGIIPGDGWQHVGNFADKFDVDKKKPRIEVIVENGR